MPVVGSLASLELLVHVNRVETDGTCCFLSTRRRWLPQIYKGNEIAEFWLRMSASCSLNTQSARVFHTRKQRCECKHSLYRDIPFSVSHAWPENATSSPPCLFDWEAEDDFALSWTWFTISSMQGLALNYCRTDLTQIHTIPSHTSPSSLVSLRK